MAGSAQAEIPSQLGRSAVVTGVCTENLIRIFPVSVSAKLAR